MKKQLLFTFVGFSYISTFAQSNVIKTNSRFALNVNANYYIAKYLVDTRNTIGFKYYNGTTDSIWSCFAPGLKFEWFVSRKNQAFGLTTGLYYLNVKGDVITYVPENGSSNDVTHNAQLKFASLLIPVGYIGYFKPKKNYQLGLTFLFDFEVPLKLTSKDLVTNKEEDVTYHLKGFLFNGARIGPVFRIGRFYAQYTIGYNFGDEIFTELGLFDSGSKDGAYHMFTIGAYVLK